MELELGIEVRGSIAQGSLGGAHRIEPHAAHHGVQHVGDRAPRLGWNALERVQHDGEMGHELEIRAPGAQCFGIARQGLGGAVPALDRFA